LPPHHDGAALLFLAASFAANTSSRPAVHLSWYPKRVQVREVSPLPLQPPAIPPERGSTSPLHTLLSTLHNSLPYQLAIPTRHTNSPYQLAKASWRKENYQVITLANVRTTAAVLPPRIIPHGLPGVGKTSLAAKFPAPIFLQTEDGCPAGLEIATFGMLPTYDHVTSAIIALGNEPHNFQTVVIDTVDATEPLIWNATCAANNWKSIESAGYGKGYVEADRFWQDLLTGLDWLRRTRNIAVVLLAHSSVEVMNDPRAPSYTSYQLKLHKRGRALVQDWADAIGFLSTELVILSEEKAFGKRTRADGSSARYLHWEGKPAFIAKNRYNLPAKMPVPRDFDYQKHLAPFFPASAGQSHSRNDDASARDASARDASVSHNQHNSDDASDGASDGADRDVRIEIAPETSTTGESAHN
jgi:hypothetical protein